MKGETGSVKGEMISANFWQGKVQIIICNSVSLLPPLSLSLSLSHTDCTSDTHNIGSASALPIITVYVQYVGSGVDQPLLSYNLLMRATLQITRKRAKEDQCKNFFFSRGGGARPPRPRLDPPLYTSHMHPWAVLAKKARRLFTI